MEAFFWCPLLLLLTTCRPALTVVVTTTNGNVKGSTSFASSATVNHFKGIPYAKPPVGMLRFKKPEPVENWSPSVLVADELKPACIQLSNLPTMTESYRQHPTNFSEDCLYLNIWVKSGSVGAPVFVWFHGGAFATGSVTIGLYDGLYFAGARNAVVVTVNYRLGPLGFSYLGNDIIPGNMGLYDQQMAMRWVKTNIEAFGGSSSLITIVGQEAGAAAAGFHLLAPSSHDLFNNAILQSGSPLAEWTYNDATHAKHYTKKLAEHLNCPPGDAAILSCFKAADIQQLTDSQYTVQEKGLPFVPVIDGVFLPDDPETLLMKGRFKNTSVLHGAVTDEGSLNLLPYLLKVINKTSPPTNLYLYENDYMTLLTGFLKRRKEELNATIISKFYVGGEVTPSPATDYLGALIKIWSDLAYKCPIVKFGSYFSQSHTLFQYSYNFRTGKIPYPGWMGVPDSYELESTMGIALNPVFNFHFNEKTLANKIIKYWVNFAKSGDPNSPVLVGVAWPQHDAHKKYLAINNGRYIAVTQGLCHRQCNFVHSILPVFPKAVPDSDESGSANQLPHFGLILVASVCISLAAVL